jgi:putative nucleotidyltransferase with HDIG domain
MALVQEKRWAAHPRIATVLRLLVYGCPAGAAAIAAIIVRRVVAAHVPSVGSIGAIAASLAAASLTLVAGERLGRRLLPLVALLKMSLLFPDQMPSRLGVALKAASPKRLARIAASDGYDSHSAEHVLSLVAALNAHDRRTRGHSERVRALTMLVAEEMEITGEARDKLEWAALLHDIGKMSVPATILNKNGRPDKDEWAVLQGHPAAGAEFSTDLHEWLGSWRHAIDQHHEKFDGTGYPLALGGSDIALGGRIVAVTDAFETMTATRAYKKPMTAQAARAELVKCSGSHFDPTVVRAFTGVALARLHRAMGPLSWLTSLPFAGGVSSGVRIGAAIVGGTTAPVLAATMAAALPMIAIVDSAPAPAAPPAAEQAFADEPISELAFPEVSIVTPSESATRPSAAEPRPDTDQRAEEDRAAPVENDAATPGSTTDRLIDLPDVGSTPGDASDPSETLGDLGAALGDVAADTTDALQTTTRNVVNVAEGILDPNVGLGETVDDIGTTVDDALGSVAAIEAGLGEVVSGALGGQAGAGTTDNATETPTVGGLVDNVVGHGLGGLLG